MDHHCPWTINCVSHRTFPHFFRFLFYAVASMAYLEYLLYTRVVAIWNLRHLPSVRALTCLSVTIYWYHMSVSWTFSFPDGSSFCIQYGQFIDPVCTWNSACAECMVLGCQCDNHRKLGNRKTRSNYQTCQSFRGVPWRAWWDQGKDYETGVPIWYRNLSKYPTSDG